MPRANELLVEVVDHRVVVRLRGTSLRAIYVKGDNPWLSLAEVSDDDDAAISLSEFRVLAWSAANERARLDCLA
jgi:hypothetical protein